VSLRLSFDADQLDALCRRHGIRKLSLFGSVLEGRDRPDSDVDLLVEYGNDAHPTYLDMAQAEHELSALLGGRRVDLRTAAELSVHFRDDIVRRAQVEYVAG